MRYTRFHVGLLTVTVAFALTLPWVQGGQPSTIHYFPQIGDGGGIRTVFLVVNPQLNSCNVQISLFRDDGAPWPLPLTGGSGPNLNFDLPAGGSVRFVSPGEPPAPTVGWARINASSPVAAQVLFEIRTGSSLVTQAAVESTGPMRNVILFFDETAGTGTGLAVANISPVPIRIDISEYSEEGVHQGDAQVPLDPRRQTAKFVRELLGGELRRGSLRIQATGPVIITTLQQTGLVLSTLPVVNHPQRSQ